MVWLEAAIIIFEALVWLIPLAVAGLFVFALICETIESIRDHNRRAARLGAQVPPAPAVSAGWIGAGLVSRLRHSLHL